MRKVNPSFLWLDPCLEVADARGRDRPQKGGPNLLADEVLWVAYISISLLPPLNRLSFPKESEVRRRKKENGDDSWKLVLGQVVSGCFCGI